MPRPRGSSRWIDIQTDAVRNRLGSRYWIVIAAGQGLSWVPVSALWFVAIAPYYDAAYEQVVVASAASAVMTIAAAIWAAVRAKESIQVLATWCHTPEPSRDQSVAAWHVVTASAYEQYRRDVLRINGLAVIPSCLIAASVWNTTLFGAVVMLIACVIPAAFATVVGFGMVEILSRPLIRELAAELPDDFIFVRRGLPLVRRLRISVLVLTCTSGITVLALLGAEGGARGLLLGVVVSALVGLAIAIGPDVILDLGVTGEVQQLCNAMQAVQRGALDIHVPVTASDELGELASTFNLMVRDLRERERMRRALTTYMDKEVARIVLADEIPEFGFAVEVSILFCDITGFTTFADGAEPEAVIARLNQIFSLIVPGIERHGGHVDKFIGDGLLAVFGAPEFLPDHADRAVSAALDAIAAVRFGGGGLEVVAGVNTGRVVAGPVGGAGRLNFSVIGDSVNIAARVEAATRGTGDSLLITDATRRALVQPWKLASRGRIPLKGKEEAIELFAPLAGSNSLPDLARSAAG